MGEEVYKSEEDKSEEDIQKTLGRGMYNPLLKESWQRSEGGRSDYGKQKLYTLEEAKKWAAENKIRLSKNGLNGKKVKKNKSKGETLADSVMNEKPQEIESEFGGLDTKMLE